MNQLEHKILERFAATLKATGKSVATVESYCRDAKHFISYLEANQTTINEVEPDALVAYQEYLAVNNLQKENSIRRKVIGTRQFFRFLTEEKQITHTPFDSVPIPERNEALPEPISGLQVESMIRKCNVGSIKGSRDAAILCLLAYEGIKASELIALKWTDFIQGKSQGMLKIPGPRARTIGLSQASTKHLILYKKEFSKYKELTSESDFETQMMIAFKGKEGAILLPKMTRHGLKFMLYEQGLSVGLNHLNTELLRHFSVNHLLSLGFAPETVMNHLGLRRLGNIAKHIAKSRSASHQVYESSH